jgi:predicted metal-binding protein
MPKNDDYSVLEKFALDLGVASAKIISTEKVVVEDRVRLKCMVCPYYGKNLKCPPYTPSIEKFRRMLNDYSTAMIVKLKPPEISGKIAKYGQTKGEESRLWNQDLNNLSPTIWADISNIYKTMLTDLLEIERAAFNQGYTFAVAFFGGRCLLCENCGMDNGCQNALMARFSAEAMGINVLKTAKNARMEIKFPSEGNKTPITPIAILLID